MRKFGAKFMGKVVFQVLETVMGGVVHQDGSPNCPVCPLVILIRIHAQDTKTRQPSTQARLAGSRCLSKSTCFHILYSSGKPGCHPERSEGTRRSFLTPFGMTAFRFHCTICGQKKWLLLHHPCRVHLPCFHDLQEVHARRRAGDIDARAGVFPRQH